MVDTEDFVRCTMLLGILVSPGEGEKVWKQKLHMLLICSFTKVPKLKV